MSKKINSVEITFENLDYVEIPAEYFADFHISGIRTSVERLTPNAILQRNQADEIRFELISKADAVLPELTQDLYFAPDEAPSLLKRITNRRDITYLDLYYDDGGYDTFYVPWEDAEDEYHNKLLCTQTSNDGNLLVIIKQR